MTITKHQEIGGTTGEYACSVYRQIENQVTYVKTLTIVDTQYSQLLLDGTQAFDIQCRTANDVRFAFEAGKVATPTDPYKTLKSGTSYFKEDVYLDSFTIYLAGAAGLEVEITAWY